MNTSKTHIDTTNLLEIETATHKTETHKREMHKRERHKTETQTTEPHKREIKMQMIEIR